ncbi:YCF48-related protein [Bacteroidota bacterium]
MKKVFLFSTLLLLLINNCSYASYNGWNLLSTRRNLTSIVFISDTKGWIFGGDIAYKTIDGGLSWSYPIKMNYNIGVSFGTGFSFKSVFFVDSLYGWAAQRNEILLRTTNGGDYWTTLNTGLGSHYDLYTVHFVNRLTGWAVGRHRFEYPTGAIVKTTNGGVNWFPQNNTINKPYNSVYMLNENKGFVASYESDTIGITTNGGNTWLKVEPGNWQYIRGFWFNDTLNGWALGHYGNVLKTTNGGFNWNVYSTPHGNPVSFYFLNMLTGWLTTRNGSTYASIFKTTNGCESWVLQYSSPSSYEEGNEMMDVFFRNENTGWALKINGMVFKSTNGGTNWTVQINPLGSISSIYFSDILTGWLSSNFYDGHWYGFLYKTTNGGINWDKKYVASDTMISGLTFINNTTGFASAKDKIYKTVNGGENWIAKNISGADCPSVFFINYNTGWACGHQGKIIKTTNSGENWVFQQSNVYCPLNDIYFTNSQTGYIAADSSYILNTTNGGMNWSKTSLYSSNTKYRAIQFINSNTGFVIGNQSYSAPPYPSSNRLLFKTTNSGQSWTLEMNQGSTGDYFYNNLFFLNSNMGWIITSYGEIKKTTNGGENWISEQSPLNENLRCIHFVNEDAGWIGGERGTVLTTNPLTGIQITSNKIPQKYNLKQNYPNPFNPVTKIGYDLVKNGYVVLKIYDLLGREIASLVNEKQNAGSYLVEWNASGFPSGVYFYRLETEEYRETKKLLLIK